MSVCAHLWVLMSRAADAGHLFQSLLHVRFLKQSSLVESSPHPFNKTGWPGSARDGPTSTSSPGIVGTCH